MTGLWPTESWSVNQGTFEFTQANKLTGITDQLEEASFQLQVLRMRVGNAWELVFTDYGFTKQPSELTLLITDGK